MKDYLQEIDLNKCFYYPDIDRIFEKYKEEKINLNKCFYYEY